MYKKSVLPNGLRVVSESVPFIKSVSIGAWVGTGSRGERGSNHGVSHFIEHLLFKGTKRRSARDIAEAIDAVGGQLNAFTAKEYTCYYAKVLASHLPLAMDILSDMLLHARFAPADIDREREVVREEIKMYEDTPDEIIHDIYLEHVWQNHPLGRNILGTVDSLAQISRDVIQAYYHDFYTPDNVVIAAAGAVDHDALVELTARYFDQWQGAKKEQVLTPPALQPVWECCQRDTEQVHLCLGTSSVPQDDPDVYAVHVVNNILGGGISSRLFQSIREEQGLAYSVYSFQTNYRDAGLFTVYAGTRPANTAAVVELILQNMSRLKRHGITTEELTKSKEQLKGSLLLGLESSSGLMSRLGKMEISLNKYISIDEVLANIARITVQDIYRLCAQMFAQEKLCLTALGPLQDLSRPSSGEAM